MEAYINAAACISHHPTFSENFFFEEVIAIPSSNTLFITPPVYKDLIPANSLRRASHILKMGISTGMLCLKNAGTEQTDAIIIGTAMGCYEDTDKFLRDLINQNEKTLAPTPFIQSTHNTVAGQLALLLKCHGYNFTYVQQNLSFEYALLDALLLLKEGDADHILVGGVDELNPPLCELFERAGHIKKQDENLQELWNSNSKGFIAGEGAAFFDLCKTKTNKSLAKINGIKVSNEIKTTKDLHAQTFLFLEELGLKTDDISLVLSGINGNADADSFLNQFTTQLQRPVAYFKHLCGEYFTASSFALWFAANILKKQIIPSCTMAGEAAPKKLQHILIVNHREGEHYSLICLSVC